ncbi:acyltransferase [Pseudidiomarina salilacus]|uniref:acyltransferase n=1 Tax=Pseudidiomarina salilacus TaxID=3384452 RepID=UPI0039850F83
MSGRNSFRKFGFLISILSKLFNLLPLNLACYFSSFFDSSESRFSLLIRYLLLKRLCISVGENIFIGKNVVLKNISNLELGSNVSIHSFSYIDAVGYIKIGNDVSIAHNCSLVSFEHTWDDPNVAIKYNRIKLAPITIDDDVWIGCGVRILSNSSISNRCVIAAGAVVKGVLDSNSVYGGVPARKLKSI